MLLMTATTDAAVSSDGTAAVVQVVLADCSTADRTLTAAVSTDGTTSAVKVDVAAF